jgi:carbamoyltransferase
MIKDSPGLVLGLNYSGAHDSAVALLEPSGDIVSACALERLSRVKQDSRWPESLLSTLPWDRVETVAVPTDEWPWSPLNPHSQLHPVPLTAPRSDFLAHGQPFYDHLTSLPRPVRFVCHQAAHAASAFWLSGFDEALCLTYDGGMFNSPWFGGLYRANRSGIEPLDRFASSHYAKITTLYSIVTALLGFTPNKHEGKITGLAAYGRSTGQICDVLYELLTTDYLEMESVAEWFHIYSDVYSATLSTNPVAKAKMLSRFGDARQEDIAATLQTIAEDHVLEILRRARDHGWQSDAICLAGGLFANVKINQRVKELGFRSIFIAPPMTDDGTALGAALAVVSDGPAFQPKAVAHMFLGPDYGAGEIEAALQQFGLRYSRVEQPEQLLAERLSEGAVVGIFQGCMEFGPRALGNRSILSQATDPTINRSLNDRLRRTEFMPFAPITRAEDAAECYVGLDGAEHAARFMTITCGCMEEMRRKSPAAVHVDGTARPQLVDRETTPLLHAILSAYRERTGIASLINTSFNVHEEPIVCSPLDAIRGFLETGIDYLYLAGGFLISFQENLPAAVKWMRQALAMPDQKEEALAAENAVVKQRAGDYLAAVHATRATLSESRKQAESLSNELRETAATSESYGEKLVFIISQPRTGSTLLQKILATHPDVHTVSEPWIALHPLFALRDSGISAPYDAALARHALSEFLHSFPDGEEIYWNSQRRMLTTLYNAALEASGKRIFLDKTPRYYFVIPELRRLFPKAKFIFLIRNPAAVLSSILEAWVQSEDIARLRPLRDDLLLAPKLLLEGIRDSVPGSIVVRYEDLVSAPERVVSGLCGHLGIEFDPSIIQYGATPEQERWLYGDQITLHEQDHPVTDHIDRWRRVLNRSAVWESWAHSYIATLGPHILREMGYDYSKLVADFVAPPSDSWLAQISGISVVVGGKSESLLSLEQAARLIEQQKEQTLILERAAAERLAALQEKETAIAQLHSQLLLASQRADALEAAAQERLVALQEKETAIAQLHSQLLASQRADALETAAQERLVALQKRDNAIAQLHSQLLLASQRADALETAAQECLAALREKELAIQDLNSKMHDAEERITSLQQAAEADLASLRSSEAELSRTRSELIELKHRFETESLRAYLYRRFHRNDSDRSTMLK